ncbi:MAG TPA: outer membrane beta-barrel protein [Burkholderiales bacterium]|nr:outer membrane beta-barrel protein [Burkholderiales bacterium]
MKKAITVTGLLALLFAAATHASEPAAEKAGGWWGGIDFGVASVSREYSVTADTRDTTFTLAFRGGYSWHPRLLLGVELGGWLLEATNSYTDDWPPEGEGIQTFYGMAQFYPVSGSPIFLKAGWGHVRYWNERLGEGNANGTGTVVGAGYDFAMGSNFYISPLIEYAWGKYDDALSPPGIVQNQRYQAVTLKIGFTYR